WSIPTSAAGPPWSSVASHSAIPRRVQYLRRPGGGQTSFGGCVGVADYTRKPFKLVVGVDAPE
ncbi:MAG: hypothetical protein ACKOEZ_08995, partial [Spartobacteria bacterium]